jgi:hypothetical protein
VKIIAKTAPVTGIDPIDIPAPQVRPGELLVKVQSFDAGGSDLCCYLWELAAPQIFPPFSTCP